MFSHLSRLAVLGMRVASRFGVSQSPEKHPTPHPGAARTLSGRHGNLIAPKVLHSSPQLPAAYALQGEKGFQGHPAVEPTTQSSSDPFVLQVDFGSPPGTASWPSPPPLDDLPREPIETFPRPTTSRHAEIMALLGPRYRTLPRGRGRELAESWTLPKHHLASSRGVKYKTNRIENDSEDVEVELSRSEKKDWLITHPSRSFWRKKSIPGQAEQGELDGQCARRSISTPDLRSAVLGPPLRWKEGPGDRFALSHHVCLHPAMRPGATTMSRWK